MDKRISAIGKEVKDEIEKQKKETEKHKKETEKLKKDNKELKEQVKELQSKNSGDINCKLSGFAQHAIEDSKGPMKPDVFFSFLMNDIFDKRNKEILPVIRKYDQSINIDEFRKQLTQVFENIEAHMKYREKQKKLDDKLIKILKNIKNSVEEEQQKEMKTEISSSKEGCVKESSSTNQGMPAKEIGKCSRKRKHKTDEESSSSQESEITHITRGVSNSLSSHSFKNSPQSSDSVSLLCAEPMSVDSSEDSQSTYEPMSISERSSSQCDAMSISEGSSSQSNDNLVEISKKDKTAKLAGKVSKQPESRLEENSPGRSRSEETVSEKYFPFKGKKARKY